MASDQPVTVGEESARSSVTLSVNAKGHRQWQIKVYAPDLHPDSLESARDLAAHMDEKLADLYGLPG